MKFVLVIIAMIAQLHKQLLVPSLAKIAPIVLLILTLIYVLASTSALQRQPAGTDGSVNLLVIKSIYVTYSHFFTLVRFDSSWFWG